MEQEIRFQEIWEIIKKRWLILVVFPLLAALIGGGISFYVLNPVYQSSVTLIVGRKASDLEGPLAARDLLAGNTLEANRLLAKTYGEIAKSRKVTEQVIAELGLGLTIDQLNSKISVTQVQDTEILEIAATDSDPQLAADIANVTMQKFSAAVIEIKKVDSVSVIDIAIPAAAPIKPKKTENILIAFIIGLIAALGLSFVLEYLDNTIKTSQEAEEFLGLPVLGVILDYQYDDDKKGESYAGTLFKNLKQP